MTTYFESPDGHGESTLWAVEGNRHAVPAMRQSDVSPGFWTDVVARMTGTTVTADDATKAVLRRALEDAVWPFLAHDPHKPEVFWPMMVDAVLAALAGVPND